MFRFKRVLLMLVPMLLWMCFSLADNTFAQPYFTISTEPTPSKFKQDEPRLFNGRNGEFVVVWRDYRDGHEGYYAQLFDEQGKRAYPNFPVFSNEAFAFGANGAYVSFGHEDDGHFFNRGFFQIYPPTGIYLNPTQVTEFRLPPDFFFGCPATATFLSATQNGFLIGDAYGYDTEIRSFDLSGELVSSRFDYTLPEFDALGFAMAATWAGDYAVFWIGTGEENNEERPYTNTTLYAHFLDSNHQVLADSVILGNPQNPCDAGATMQTVTLKDSLYQLFYTSSDTLWSVLVDRSGNLIRDLQVASTQPIELPGDSSPEVRISNIVDSEFIIHVFKSNKIRRYNFNINGDPVGDSILDGLYYDVSNFHKVDENISQVPQARNDDIYLYTLNESVVIDSVKLNDNLSGANHIAPSVIPAANDQFMVFWMEEGSGARSRLFEADGSPAGDELSFGDRSGVFLPSGEYVTFWREASNQRHKVGYRVYSQNWEILNEQLLQDRLDTFYPRALAAPVNENEFLVLLQDSAKIRLMKVSQNEGILVEKSLLEESDLSPLKIAVDKKGTIWALWRKGNGPAYLQTFDIHLNALSSIINVPSAFPEQIAFLSNGNFAYLARISLPATELGYHLIIRDTIHTEASVDTIIEEFQATQASLTSIDGQTLLFTSVKSNAIWYQTFDESSTPIVDKTMIYQTDRSFYLESAVATGEGHVLFAWSDAVKPGNGFDILGRSIPLSTIVKVENKPDLPQSIQLRQNYPNPFNPETTIKFSILNTGFVKLEIYNVLGESVRKLLAKEMSPGEYTVVWDGKNERGQAVASGVYVYKLQAGTFAASQKMILLR